MRFPPYSRYAAVYDAIGQRHFGERIAAATLAWLEERDLRPRTVLDLGCGTGAATAVFASAGLSAIGLDRSREMLTQAREFASAAGLAIDWIEGDMRRFALARPVELATSFFDSMNYLTDDDDLDRAFAAVHAILTADGLFVFDLNTRRRFAEGWGNATVIAADRGDLFGVYRSWFEPETGLSPLLLTFFSRRPGATVWDRFDEEHVERAHDLDDVARALDLAGFDLIDLRAFHDGSGQLGGQGTEASERVVFFARRRTDEPFVVAAAAR